MPSTRYFVGVDVGTGSARAALFTATGRMVRSCVEPTRTWNPLPDHYEQSSADIWRAVCKCVKTAIAGHDAATIAGIGFDATCSLVVCDAAGAPLSVSARTAAAGDAVEDAAERNIILWMDHRATEQTDRINATGHRLLRHVGGRCSPEAQCPKMCWLRERAPQTWSRVGQLFDLPDWLTWRATGNASRSLCSAVAKFNYDALAGGWCDEWFEQIGLGELRADGYAKIGGANVLRPGTAIGEGLTAEAASELGLRPGIAVGASLVDAYAGGLSLFGCRTGDEKTPPQTAGRRADEFQSRMALICGTSTGHMSFCDRPVWAQGAWGPFKDVLFAGQFVHSAGQSCSGILVDHIIRTHPAYEAMLAAAGDRHAHAYLNGLLAEVATRRGVDDVATLTADLHVWPDYHGNRSPLDDPSMRGMASGLDMRCDVESLAVFYLAFVQALAYGTRHILDAMQRDGRAPFEALIMCGGLSKNALFVQTYADACALPVLLPDAAEAVLLGAAMLGAVAGGAYATLEAASRAMAGTAATIRPRPAAGDYHRRKYAVFRKMSDDQRAYRRLMSDV